MSVGKQIRDLGLYVLIAVATVLALVLWAVRAPVGTHFPGRWIGLAGATAITFGYPLRWYRRYWGGGLFWLSLAGLFVLHVGVYIVILTTVESWPLLLFALITPAEWLVICPVLDRAGRISNAPKRPGVSARGGVL